MTKNMQCTRCPKVRDKINDAMFEKKTDNSYWDFLCLVCFKELDPIYRKKDIKLGDGYLMLNRRGALGK